MNYNKILIKYSKLLLIFLLAFLPNSSCQLIEIIAVDCNKCYTNFPDEEYITVEVTINEDNRIVPITVFYGPFENNNIAFETTITQREKDLWLETDKHYTLRAEYIKNGRTYFVVNGAKLTTRKDTESCDEPCYYVTGKNVNLELKF